MDEGISVQEACEIHALTPEDFDRLCTKDGNAKEHSDSTTFTLQTDSPKSFTISNTVLYAGLAITILLLVALVLTLLIRKRHQKR